MMIETLLDGFGKAAAPAAMLAAMFTMKRRKRHALPAWAASAPPRRLNG